MKVEFRKSFEKDLGKIRDEDLFLKIKTVIKEVETAESLLNISNTYFETVESFATI